MIKIYWCNGPNGTNNFGDFLGPYIISKLTDKIPLKVEKSCNDYHIVSIGSIADNTSDKAIIWGSGLIMEKLKINPKSIVLGVRGKLTKKCFKYFGIKTHVIGDPAILMPLLYKPKSYIKKHKIGIIPHYVDYEYITSQNINIYIINILDDVETIIDNINSCEFILSSSLHGLIISHAYNIPVIPIKIDDKLVGDEYKFIDYLSSYNKEYKRYKKVRLDYDINNIEYYKIYEQKIRPDIKTISTLQKKCLKTFGLMMKKYENLL